MHFLHLHTPENISWQQALCCVPVILLLVLEPQALVLAVNNDPNKKKHLLLFFCAHQHKAAGMKTKQKQRLQRLLIRRSLC